MTFVTVPSKYRLMEVDAVAQSVYLWLCSHIDEDCYCWPSISTLMRYCHASRNTIKNRIGVLERAGLITKKLRKERGGRNTSNLYHVIADDYIPSQFRRSTADSDGARDDRLAGQGLATNENHTKQKTKNHRGGTWRALSPKEFAKEFFTEGSALPARVLDAICRDERVQRDIAEIEMHKFRSYWTEPTHDGTQMRWELEGAFGVKKRFLGWLGKRETN